MLFNDLFNAHEGILTNLPVSLHGFERVIEHFNLTSVGVSNLFIVFGKILDQVDLLKFHRCFRMCNVSHRAKMYTKIFLKALIFAVHLE